MRLFAGRVSAEPRREAETHSDHGTLPRMPPFATFVTLFAALQCAPNLWPSSPTAPATEAGPFGISADTATDTGVDTAADTAADTATDTADDTATETGVDTADSACAPEAEVCNDLDDDCDGVVDDNAGEIWELYADADGDGFGDPDAGYLGCRGATSIANKRDCDDTNALISPLAAEGCNEFDDDCDGETDEIGATGCVELYPDGDGDGVGAGDAVCACEGGPYSAVSGDCDDGHPLLVSTCGAMLVDGLSAVSRIDELPGQPVAYADFNGDGLEDVATAGLAFYAISESAVAADVWLGEIAEEREYYVGNFDGDGDSDVVIRSAEYSEYDYHGYVVSCHVNTYTLHADVAANTFAQTYEMVGPERCSTTYGNYVYGGTDADGDGDLDLLDMMSDSSNSVLSYEIDADGTDPAALEDSADTFISSWSDPCFHELGDVNGDGAGDVFDGSYLAFGPWAGSTSLAYVAITGTGLSDYSLAADLDGDGAKEWVAANWDGTGQLDLANFPTADAIWSSLVFATIDAPVGSYLLPVDAADLDGDGDDELLFVAAYSGGASTYFLWEGKPTGSTDTTAAAAFWSFDASLSIEAALLPERGAVAFAAWDGAVSTLVLVLP